MNKEVYFDSAATVPMLPEVIENIYKDMQTIWGNPSSQHQRGMMAKAAMDQYRQDVADYIGCDADEIIFTGSASAANNLALKGFVEANNCQFVLSPIGEHKSVWKTLSYLKEKNAIHYWILSIDETGRVDTAELEKILNTFHSVQFLVSIGIANSEIGTVQDIDEIGKIVHQYHGTLHVDATQYFTKGHINLDNIDMMTVGGSKIGAGKGIGILYKKKHIQLEPLVHGGGQEYGLIAGTEDVPKIGGIATAMKRREYHSIEQYRWYFIEQLAMLKTPHIINGHPKYHLDNILSVSFKDHKADAIVDGCSALGLYISAGSACDAGNPNLSPTIAALNLPMEYAAGTVRFSLPQDVTCEDIDLAIKILQAVLDEV